MTREECLKIVRQVWGPVGKHTAEAIWDDAYDAGWNDAIPFVTDGANKTCLCGVMIALHEYGWEPEQLQKLWDRVIDILMSGALDELISEVENKLGVQLVDGAGNKL